MALFCQPPDPDQGVAAAESTGCERRIAHLLRLAHHRQQRVCIRLLIAGEQRLRVLPAARRGDVLERVMLSLCRPLPAIRVPQPTFQLRQLCDTDRASGGTALTWDCMMGDRVVPGLGRSKVGLGHDEP